MPKWEIAETGSGEFHLTQDGKTALMLADEYTIESYLRTHVKAGDKVTRVDADGYRVRDTGYGRRRHWRE